MLCPAVFKDAEAAAPGDDAVTADVDTNKSRIREEDFPVLISSSRRAMVDSDDDAYNGEGDAIDVDVEEKDGHDDVSSGAAQKRQDAEAMNEEGHVPTKDALQLEALTEELSSLHTFAPLASATAPATVVPADKLQRLKIQGQVQSAILTASSSNATNLSKLMRQTDDGSGWVSRANINAKIAASDLWSSSGLHRTHTSKQSKLTGDDAVKIETSQDLTQPTKTKLKTTTSQSPGPVPERVRVSLFTTDFSMQNVSLQLGLFILSAQGLVVTQIRRWVLRCMACYTLQGTDLTRLFCKRCGAAHMSRVACSLQRNGSLQLHLRKGYQVDTAGMKYSLPAPGKQDRFEGEVLLREDQLLLGIWRQKAVRVRRDVQSAFGEDVTDAIGMHLNKQTSLHVGMGARSKGNSKGNPNAQKGRERRGKKKLN
jgi:rRNA maturation endonuclease Nob1